jgi:hypothetical protein
MTYQIFNFNSSHLRDFLDLIRLYIYFLVAKFFYLVFQLHNFLNQLGQSVLQHIINQMFRSLLVIEVEQIALILDRKQFEI